MKTLLAITFSLALIIFTSSCKTEGCTDPKAKNFSYEATKDDGSCDYSGCTDPDALNYDPDAVGSDGSCTYLGDVKFITTRSSVAPNNVFLALKIDGAYSGKLQNTCADQFPSCQTACSHVNFTEKESGAYTFQFWEIKQTGSNIFDTLFVGTPTGFQVIGKECNIVLIE